MNQLLLIPLAYLLGSFPSAYVAGRLIAGIDIKQHGSGNVGGTNTLRVLGPGPGIAVALADVFKALLPTLWARQLFGGNVWPTLLVALAAVLGHNFSIWLRFRGGKGIATTIGASIALFPVNIAILVAVAILIVLVTRYVSLASLALVLLLPGLLWFRGATSAEIWFGIILAAMGVVRHSSNIKRLLSGTENKIGSQKKQA
ncbi:MAG: glycerol-3-phosphate 1-O-acyltransferase PlsY [Bacillota bacterium]|jgi:glycerol-3-phosphate acyltransferase PlsY